MSEQGPTVPEKHGAPAFWTSLPGILTGIAAVITALVGLFALLGPGDDGADGGSVPAAERLETSAAADPAPPEPVPPAGAVGGTPTATSDPATADGAAIPGQVTMRSPDEADLESGRVGMGVDGSDLYLYCSAGECRLNAAGSGGLITIVDVPTDRAGCVAALRARQDGVLETADLTPGAWFCMQTDEAALALVEITGAPGVGTAELVLDYTLWQ